GVVIEVTRDGRESVRYVQEGWVHTLAHWRTPHGNYLAAGGVDSTESLPSVALVDLDAPPARWPVGDGDAACDNCPTGRPHAVMLFPTSDVTHAMQRAYDRIGRFNLLADGLRLTTEGVGVLASVGVVRPDLSIAEFDHAD